DCGRVLEALGVAAAVFLGEKFSPARALAVGAARQPAPMLRIRTDADAVAELLGDPFAAEETMRGDLEIRSDLLRPVSRYAAADGEDAEVLLLLDDLGVEVEVEEAVAHEALSAVHLAPLVVHRDVEPHLGVRERGDDHRDVVLVGALQDRARVRLLLLDVLAETAAQLRRRE